MTQHPLQRFMDATEIAALLKVSKAAAYRLIQQCEHVNLGRSVRVTEAALRTFIDARTAPGTPSPIERRGEYARSVIRRQQASGIERRQPTLGNPLPDPNRPRLRAVFPRTKPRRLQSESTPI